MEENEQLEEAGNRVTGGEEGEDLIHGPEGSDTVFDKDRDGQPSERPFDQAEGEASSPDPTNIKENPDPEPGVPDQDF